MSYEFNREWGRLRAHYAENTLAPGGVSAAFDAGVRHGKTFKSDLELKAPLGSVWRKKSGAEWSGRVVGYYSTTLTSEGLCIESDKHAGSVQIYPMKALERIDQ